MTQEPLTAPEATKTALGNIRQCCLLDGKSTLPLGVSRRHFDKQYRQSIYRNQYLKRGIPREYLRNTSTQTAISSSHLLTYHLHHIISRQGHHMLVTFAKSFLSYTYEFSKQRMRRVWTRRKFGMELNTSHK